jgi:hypothetical protein
MRILETAQHRPPSTLHHDIAIAIGACLAHDQKEVQAGSPYRARLSLSSGRSQSQK